MFGDLISTRDADINLAFTNSSGYISSRKEHEGDIQPLDVGDVATVISAELQV